jgi:hypothetical protein
VRRYPLASEQYMITSLQSCMWQVVTDLNVRLEESNAFHVFHSMSDGEGAFTRSAHPLLCDMDFFGMIPAKVDHTNQSCLRTPAQCGPHYLHNTTWNLSHIWLSADSSCPSNSFLRLQSLVLHPLLFSLLHTHLDSKPELAGWIHRIIIVVIVAAYTV